MIMTPLPSATIITPLGIAPIILAVLSFLAPSFKTFLSASVLSELE